jgi:putative tricarboxylic transport membrane protein
LKLSKDGWTGLAVLAASLLLFALTLDLKPSPLVPIGPGFYPRIVLGITALLAAALLVFDLLATVRPEAAQGANYTLVLTVFVIFGVYVGALPFLGFRLATVVFVAALQSVLDPPRSRRGWILIALTALLTSAVCYVVFEKYLQVFLPRGRWTDF